MMAAFLLYQLIKSTLMIMTTPATLSVTLAMLLFALVALLSIGLMLNDYNKSEISKLELEFFSNYDPMTLIPNIRYFKKEVQSLTD